jgi:hypothetical protein
MNSQPWPARYQAEKPMFRFFWSTYTIKSHGELRLYARQKAFRLKETINVYTDATQTHCRLQISARNVIDFSATYDVTDATTGERVGSLQRQGIKSFFRDSWIINDQYNQQIGAIQEDSKALALIRRLFLRWIPQSFHITVGGHPAGTIRQRFRFFKLTYDVDHEHGQLDNRLGLAASILLLAIEGRQK